MFDWLRPELARRLLWEVEAVKEQFPGRFRLHAEAGATLAWHGAVPLEGQDFPLVVTYPAAYPALPPRLETTIELPAGCPHILGRRDGLATLCWLGPSQTLEQRRWQPQRHTAATVLLAGQRWGLAFLVWRTLEIWPVPDAHSM